MAKPASINIPIEPIGSIPLKRRKKGATGRSNLARFGHGARKMVNF
jgi:hypothetical protein